MTERLFGSKEHESGAGTEETRPPLRSLGPSVNSRTYPESGNAMMCNRGVWKAPWMGPNGEFVLIVIDSKRRLVNGPVTIPVGGDHLAVADALWDFLEVVDPVSLSTPLRPLRFSLLARRRGRADRLLHLDVVS